MQRDLLLTNVGPARDAKDTLDRLEDMAQDHVDLFYEKIWYVSSITGRIGLTAFRVLAVAMIG